MNLGTVYFYKYYWDNKPQKCTQKPAPSSPVAKEESVSNVAYIVCNVETKEEVPREDYSEYLCTAVF